MIPLSWLQRSNLCVSQGGLTNSKWPESYIRGVYPTHISAANGCYLYDTDHKKYIDFVCGLGSNLFGYGNEQITKKIISQIYNGANHSFPTIYEVLAAEKLKEFFPFVDRVKWTKTGSEACNAAIRFARAKTGRIKVLSQGYHGIADQFVSLTPPAKGVSPQTGIENLNQDLSNDFSDVAAVIIEPVVVDYSLDRIKWLKNLRDICDKNSCILIFDEVITCLRFKNYSVSKAFNITPDLMCIGKAIGGGLSLAGVAGKSEILDDKQVFVSSTYAGETFPLIAGVAGMELLQKSSDYNINFLWEKGQEFIDSFNSSEGVQIEGYPTRGIFKGSIEDRALFCQEMAKADILFNPTTWFFNFPLIKVMDDVLEIVKVVKYNILNKKCKLEFPLPVTPFAAKTREKL